MKSIIKGNISELKKELVSMFDLVYKEHENLFISAFKPKKEVNWKFNEPTKIYKMHQKIFKTSIYYFASFNMYGLELRTLIAYFLINLEIKRISDYGNNLIKYYKKSPIEHQKTPQIQSYWKQILINFQLVTVQTKKPNLEELASLIEQIKSNNFAKIFPELEINLSLKKMPSREIYYFFMQFRFLERTADRLVNICEYLVFLKSFFDFRKYQTNKLSA